MTKDTNQEQSLEILIKIAHQYLQALIKHCKDNDVDGITEKIIEQEKVINFDIELTEKLLLDKRQVQFLMTKSCNALADILLDLLKSENMYRLPLFVLEDIEKNWNWRQIFKGIANPND